VVIEGFAFLILSMSRIPYRPAVVTALVFLLAGCTPTQRVTAPQNSRPQATAPAIAAVPQTAPAAPQPATAEEQRVKLLIAQVEKAFAAGSEDYRKGRLPEAKTEFDQAVDLMLSSGIDIKGSPQLQDEFDRIVDQVNALEMEALKQGNGFVPKEEPAPADVANDVTFAVDPNLVAKARTELATTKSDLPLVMNDYVYAFINFFANTQKGHNTLLHSFERAGHYKAMIQRVLAEEGVPQDLIYLAVAESGFQPRAINARSHAGGMWQFMPYGNYGLTRDRYVDERFDPEKSTRAYARYMKYLYDQLGDWYLAMAAYDHGAGNMQRAVERTGYADFWELYKRNELPRETENYVPEILAAIIIANHPKQYGFDDITLDPPLITDTVSINYSVNLQLVSDLVNVPVDEIEALNPSLLRMTTPPDGSFDLHLPAGTAALFEQRVASIPESKRDSWRYHLVTADDTLASVARSYHVSESELAAANQLGEDNNLSGVEALVVPLAPAAVASRGIVYIARRGDTLVSIADRFGVSLSQLRRWNRLTGIHVSPGRRLHVAEPASMARTSVSRRHHTSGEEAKGDPPATKAKNASSRERKGTSGSLKKEHTVHPATHASSSGTKKSTARTHRSHRKTAKHEQN